jgi:hypothetical protein
MSGPGIEEYYTMALTPTYTNVLGMDGNGNVASYAIQDDRSETTDGHGWYDGVNFFNDDQVQDPGLKVRVLMMFLQAAMVSRFYKGWGDQSQDFFTNASGSGGCALVQDVAGGPIFVQGF